MKTSFLLSTIILAALSACGKDETITAYVDQNSEYRLVSLGTNRDVPSAMIAFPEAGQVAGQAPCNLYSASVESPYPWFSLGPIAVTRRACLDMSGEAEFFATLNAMTQAEVSGRILVLRNEAGVEMVFEVLNTDG